MAARNECTLTHTGRVRSNNEDAFCSEPLLGLWVVADGMGGHEAGEVASAITIQSIVDTIRNGEDLSTAIQHAHHSILQGGREGKGAHGMGSTVVAVRANHVSYQVAWVGDSRAYLWTRTGTQQGTLEQLTTDHSYVQMLVQAGAITAREAEHHPDKNVITQCLGSLDLADVAVDQVERDWQDNQWLLLCSDGLTDELDSEQIRAILAKNTDVEIAARVLIREALASGGRDNTTVAIIDRPSSHGNGLLGKMRQWFTRKP